jgi:NADPH:quinone reductase-like Zn-dependent oxidoreductase
VRAAVYEGAGGTEVIAIRDVREPFVGTDDVLVEVAFAGLNRADILERQGRYPVPPSDIAIPGMEFSGTVLEIGARVVSLAPGDRVCGLVPAGAHAERLAAPALTLSKVPAELDLRDAAAIPEAFITAHDALFTRAGFALGQTAVVHAVGSSVGLAAVGLIRRAGGLALGTSRTADKLDRAKEHGLSSGFLLDAGWIGSVQAATGGRGADVILDFVGAPMLDQNLAALAPGGRIVQIGTMAGMSGPINLGLLMQKRAALHGTVLRSRPIEEKIALAKQFGLELLPLFARHELRAEIDALFPLADLAAAHAHMEANANFGKIVISVAAGSARST